MSAAKGRKGEADAALLLEEKGMEIVARNFRCPWGEVDIIAREGGTLVFVEVKAWSFYGLDALEQGVDLKKQHRIIETAKYFLSFNRQYTCMAIRFDVVFISPLGLTHLVSAFSEAL